MTATERESDFELTTDTPYLALTGKLWGVSCEHFEEIDRVITALHCNINAFQLSVISSQG